MKRLNTFYLALLMSLMVFVSIETGWAQQDTFNFTNGQQSFVVPAGVFSIHIQVWGAEGASGTGGPPGLGGFAEGDLAVTPGQTLGIFVGGQGCALNSDSVITTGCGGFNGGGDARGGGTGPDLGNFRGGGGGASDVRVGGTSLNNRVIVAAGGGGACGNVSSSGGNGGGLVGSPGGLEPGEGGTQTTGGQGFNSPTCLSGGFGFGGDAGTGSCAGGGGGFFGGGSGCGGGGGSSFIDGVDNGTTTSGVREGDGLVVLSWTVVLPEPIPTLSEWGLIAMAGILGIVGFMVMRRRKVSA